MAGLRGIVAYEPGEMTLIARAGTPLAEIEPMLAAAGQSLAFEPPAAEAATLGGMVAANASGPRRLAVGACRDALLGLRFVDGRGRLLKTGGRVMKNVTGLDLGKLLCGSNGTLAVLTEVAIKTLPLAPDTVTLQFNGVSAGAAVEIFSTALATPYEVSGAAWQDGSAWRGWARRWRIVRRGCWRCLPTSAPSCWCRRRAGSCGEACAIWRICRRPDRCGASSRARRRPLRRWRRRGRRCPKVMLR